MYQSIFKEKLMPPKTKFTKEQILDAAFDIANKEGFEGITIRSVADKLGASIAPIYVNFKNLDELKHALAEKITELIQDIILSTSTHDPFLDIGAGNIRLALDYRQLYSDFHMNSNCRKYFNMDNSHHEKMIEKMASSKKLDGLNQKQMGDILQIMALVTEGIIFSLLTGRIQSSYNELIEYIEDVAKDVIAGYKLRKGVTK